MRYLQCYTDARFFIRRYGCWLLDASCVITHNDVTHYKLQPQTVVFVKDNRAITVLLSISLSPCVCRYGSWLRGWRFTIRLRYERFQVVKPVEKKFPKCVAYHIARRVKRMTWGVNLRAYGETGPEFPAKIKNKYKIKKKKKSTDGTELDGILFSPLVYTERQVTQFLYGTCLMLYLF